MIMLVAFRHVRGEVSLKYAAPHFFCELEVDQVATLSYIGDLGVYTGRAPAWSRALDIKYNNGMIPLNNPHEEFHFSSD